MSKYKAQKTIIDGIVFDSRREADRYLTLKLLERAGAIKNLEKLYKNALQMIINMI